MSDQTKKTGDEHTRQVRYDRVAIAATTGLVIFLGLLTAFIVDGRIAERAWLQWLLERRWLAALGAAVVALIVLFAFDLTRRKNIAWRLIKRQYGQRSGDALHDKNHAAGQGRIGAHSYWGLRCFGSPSGLAIVRVLSGVNRPLFISWSAISMVETFPSPLTGRRGFETDMGARITLRERPSLTVEVPWLAEFRGFLPNSVKLRSTKLPGHGLAQKPSKRRRHGRR